MKLTEKQINELKIILPGSDDPDFEVEVIDWIVKQIDYAVKDTILDIAVKYGDMQLGDKFQLKDFLREYLKRINYDIRDCEVEK